MYLAHRQRRAMDKQAQHMEDGLAVTRQFADAATAVLKPPSTLLKWRAWSRLT